MWPNYLHPSMNIREMECSDIESVRKLNEESLPENYPSEFYQFYLAFNPLLCYVAEKENIIIGYVLSKLESSKNGVFVHITSICVAKKYRNLGVGGSLMLMVIGHIHKKTQELKEKTKDYRISLYVRASNEKAIRFYENKFGFQKAFVIKGYYRDGEDAYEMALSSKEPILHKHSSV